MIAKEEFLKLLKSCGVDPQEIEPDLINFEDMARSALKIKQAMPGIGFASVKKRWNCFLAVCRHLDSMKEDGEIDESGAQIVLNILRLKDRKFRKSVSIFDLHASRLTARERAELPSTAREYLAGLEYFR